MISFGKIPFDGGGPALRRSGPAVLDYQRRRPLDFATLNALGMLLILLPPLVAGVYGVSIAAWWIAHWAVQLAPACPFND